MSSLGQAFVPLSFEQGEAFQFDWSEEEGGGGWGVSQGASGPYEALRQAVGFSWWPIRAKVMRCCSDAHTRAFSAFGGVPKRGIYDNNENGRRQGQSRQATGW